MELAGPRWKGKGFADMAKANPMSDIITRLQTSLTEAETHATLLGCDALLEVGPQLADHLNRGSFGRQVITSDADKQWFQLFPEETFYLCHALNCLVVSRDNIPMSEVELWNYFRSKSDQFPEFYKAYAYLRSKNWVVRSGSQYGVDFVAYRHHPALVHAEYSVLVVPEGSKNMRETRLRVWSELYCTLRVCGSVAKTLLVLSITNCDSDRKSPSCLEEFNIEAQTITRWVPEQCREDYGVKVDGTE